MNPGPTLGWIAVGAAYTIVLLGLLVFIKLNSNREKKLDRRRSELKEGLKGR